MRTKFYAVRTLLAALILSAGLVSGLAQSGQPWPPGVRDILKLAQAQVGNDTIIAYVKNTNRRYNLNSSEIIMLKQQGISDPVLTAMLENQPAPPQPRAAPQPVRVAAAPVDYYPYYSSYCPYSYFPPVSLSFGWISGGNCWGGGWHGGSCNYGGGWHGGGGSWHH